MTNRERENATLSFQKPADRGSVEETFFPWGLSLQRWKSECPSAEFAEIIRNINRKPTNKEESYMNCLMANGCYNYEKFLGFDGVKRVFFSLPFNPFDVIIHEETDEYILRRDSSGWLKKYFKDKRPPMEIKPPVTSEEDWHSLKQKALQEIKLYYTDKNIENTYGVFREGQQKGDYSVRLAISGFFWAPRDLLGIEEHMLSFFDYPEMLHDINEFILQFYLDKLAKVLDVLPADLIYISEDLSGSNGPMLSPKLFDEFVGAYYKRLIPMLKNKGVRHIFVDTDGDFKVLIPNFMEAGIEGFLPMDVNAGMDIVEARKKFPTLKFIGAFNKLKIAEGKDAIDKEFERLLPVIRQGGFIPGCDHQVAPSTSFDDYKYYISKLQEVMKQAGQDL
jgi:predicted house-cleaning noncanonical NTP pyrophosphatase (MazG superfamily)